MKWSTGLILSFIVYKAMGEGESSKQILDEIIKTQLADSVAGASQNEQSLLDCSLEGGWRRWEMG